MILKILATENTCSGAEEFSVDLSYKFEMLWLSRYYTATAAEVKAGSTGLVLKFHTSDVAAQNASFELQDLLDNYFHLSNYNWNFYFPLLGDFFPFGNFLYPLHETRWIPPQLQKMQLALSTSSGQVICLWDPPHLTQRGKKEQTSELW